MKNFFNGLQDSMVRFIGDWFGFILFTMGGVAVLSLLFWGLYRTSNDPETLAPGVEMIVPAVNGRSALVRFRDDAGVNCYATSGSLSCVRVP